MFANYNSLFQSLNSEELNIRISLFFRNSLERKIGFSSNDLAIYDLERLIEILYAIYAWASIDASGAGGGLSKSCKGAENFKMFLRRNFYNCQEIRSIAKWESVIGITISENFIQNRGLNENYIENYNAWCNSVIREENYSEYRLVLNFAKIRNFYGMQIKTTALFFKVLIKDLNFFTDFSLNKEIFIPLDRVNLRMLTYFLLNDDKNNFMNGISITNLGNKKSQLWFNFFCYILRVGNDFPLINFENLWFIGHFYHENMKLSSNNVYNSNNNDVLTYNCCEFRNALKYGDYFVNIDENFEKHCPFYNDSNGCVYNFESYNLTLNLVH